MNNEFLQYFDEFVAKRISNLCIKLSKEDQIYAAMKNDFKEIEAVIISKLDKSNRDLFNNYENSVNNELGYIREFAYKKGFEDGIKVSNIIDTFKISDIKDLTSN